MYWCCLQVKVDNIGLNAVELAIFLRMVGPRFNCGRRELRLISSRFQNRIENKKYLIMLLENLISESKRLNAEHLNK